MKPCLSICFVALLSWTAALAELPRTTAETSQFKSTTRYADVVAFGESLAKQSPVVKATTFGTSGEGRPLPLLILSDPPANPKLTTKPVVLLIGNIHAGEVDGKEALMTFAREIATGADKDLLKELVILIVPILNADGNERIAKGKRPEQAGPDEVGDRENADGLDLNRDFVKLETPEIRSLVRLMREWKPSIAMDMHTTNGSKHRHTLTYDGPRNPNCGDAFLDFVNNKLIPSAGERLKAVTGVTPFIYGTIGSDSTRWETYPAHPRYGVHYFGLRGTLGVLSESYSYATFAERVRASLEFARGICQEAVARKDEVKKHSRNQSPPKRITLRTRLVPGDETRTLLGFDADQSTPRELPVRVVARSESTLEVLRPHAYLIPPGFPQVIENLQRHGIALSELHEDIDLDVEAFRVNRIERATRPFQRHTLTQVEVEKRDESRRVPAGTTIVRTQQPLGILASLLLEPQSEDGLVTWNFFDSGLSEGKDFPVMRLPADVPMIQGPVRPLADERTMNRPITAAATLGQGPSLSLGGNPIRVIDWTNDGHFLQSKGDTTLLIDARTGRGHPYFQPDKIAESLGACRDFDKATVNGLSRRQSFRMNADRSAALIDHNDNYYVMHFDGSPTRRLTMSRADKEFASFSPNGEWLAFVRGGNLYVAEPVMQMERPLTVDGGGQILNGKADWVYEEEIFDRNGMAYWWSPDSKHIALLRFDDSPVCQFTVVNHLPTRLNVEKIPYPKAGDPNPIVKLGIVPVVGGPPVFAEMSGYDPADMLISRVGWWPDGKSVYCYVQNRTQTWLDVCHVPVGGGPVRKLFRETTKAWVDDAGPLAFLPDGSFLFASDRSGFRHLYRYSVDGHLLHPVTTGDWEVNKVQFADADWVYFTATKDAGSGSNLCRTRVDGSAIERLTPEAGTHMPQVSPNGKMFVDMFGSMSGPAKVVLRDSAGQLVRMLDTNPVYQREEYRFGKVEPVEVPLADGFRLSGVITYPPDFDPAKKYPIWMKTYAGPHSPTVMDSWSGGRIDEQVLASLGIVVFRFDPRSASGKGRQSAWTAYKRLGVTELQDLEAAVDWIAKNSWVDTKRVGLQGHSYGGYITAYALTHSKKFSAGIAGAPVTDWRNYDSIYTERYLGLPSENAEGYDAGSVVKAAANLHGRLLIIHGLIDDNVHVQNSVQLIHELQKHDKDFEVMVYPLARHGIFGRHYQRQILNFIAKTMSVQDKLPARESSD